MCFSLIFQFITGLQSLGEEYVNVVQVDSTLRQVPSLLRRLIAVLLQSSCPFLLRLSLLRLEKLIQSGRLLILDDKIKRNILAFMPVIKQSIILAQRIHAVIFYFTGNFYHISKRISGINYASSFTPYLINLVWLEN